MGEPEESRSPHRDQAGAGSLSEALRRAAAERALIRRELVRWTPRVQAATAYHVLAGTTLDPQVCTPVALCATLDVDLDRLLGVSSPAEPRDPELGAALAETRRLPVADRGRF